MRRTRRNLLLASATLATSLMGQAMAQSVPGPISTTIPEALFAQSAATPAPRASGYRPGEPVTISGQLGRYQPILGGLQAEALEFAVQVHDPRGGVTGTFGPFVSDATGAFSLQLPAAATQGLSPGTHAVYAVAGGQRTVVGRFKVAGEDASGFLASFVSSTGWVKPGDTYPFRVQVNAPADTGMSGIAVDIPAPPSVTYLRAVALRDRGEVTASSGRIQWTVASLAAGEQATLVVEAKAADLAEDPRVVWKDLSSTATLRHAAGEARSSTHGPKVIPPEGGFESARYGDKPFPMVLVEYVDPEIGKRQPANLAENLDTVVNSPDFEGSSFNLFQEMSFGQLYPNGTVPSAGIASAGWDYEPGFEFSSLEPGPCPALTLADVPGALGSPLLPERIVDGWYQLPGQLQYYGWDDPIFPYTLVAGLSSVYSIDSGCGPTGKSVYDAAQISDPEIDYNEFDSDKDGLVDFFMLVFAGCGGNGASQLGPVGCPYSTVPYDNIWPHSSSLEFAYLDADTGLRGYISDDQLKSLEEIPQCWLNADYAEFDDCAANGGAGQDDLPVHVRVGPYNVNPETVFDAASVISHEYGHHLGLPDFYNQGADYDAYGTFNLMASDYSQHMTVFSKQDMGWIVPQFLQPGEQRTVENWAEIKQDTGEIHWQTPDGMPYVLSAANGDQNIHNGEAYAVKLPKRILIDPEKLASQASGRHAWFSGRGNDFGCSPQGGHNLDLVIPELADVAPGETVTLSFKSSWDIEWDWDYGFVLVTTDGETYESLPSANGYTTNSAFNPNNAGCLNENDNGLTGTSGAYAQGEPFVTVARNPGAPSYADGAPFLEDRYDLSAYAGQAVTIRFSYFTDAAFDRPGWFVDDVQVTAGDTVLFGSDHESGEERGRYVPGGCSENFATATLCTDGWLYISSDAGNDVDHAYYMELRDRSEFDFDGYGQSDRGQISGTPGRVIADTAENHGSGTNGVSDPPAQHYLDSTPVEGGECGTDCNDAAFTDNRGDDVFSDFDLWLDNFADPVRDSGRWEFDYNCLTAEVLSMEGENTINRQTDLTASVRLTAGQGCLPFGYGVVARSIDIDDGGGIVDPVSRPVTSRGGALAGWVFALLGLGLLQRRRRR